MYDWQTEQSIAANVNEYDFCSSYAMFIILCSLERLNSQHLVYVSRVYRNIRCLHASKETSQHIDDTSGHSQNVVLSDNFWYFIASIFFHVCSFIRSSYYYSTFSTQHVVASFSIDSFFYLLQVDVVMHLFALFFPPCAHIDISRCSTFISFDVRIVINIKFSSEIHCRNKAGEKGGEG